MSDNIYKEARLRAAEENPELATVESAFQTVCIARKRLLYIEQDDPHKKSVLPYPDEVEQLALVYNAPELRDYFCTHQCPIGKNRTPLMHDSLSEISASLMSALHFLSGANDKIHSILGDSKVSDNEIEEFKRVLKTLRAIAYSANSLELWAQKNGLNEE